MLPGPCNLHRPGGIPRIALGKGGKKKLCSCGAKSLGKNRCGLTRLSVPLVDNSDKPSYLLWPIRGVNGQLPVWAPVEPPAKRAKTAEVRLSSASDVPMPPRSDDNAKGSSDEEASDSSGSNSDVSSQDDSSDVSDHSVHCPAQDVVQLSQRCR